MKEELSYKDWKNREIKIFEQENFLTQEWEDTDIEEKLFQLLLFANNSERNNFATKHQLELRIKKDEDLIAKQQKQINMLIRELHPGVDHIKELLGLEG